MNSVRIYVNIFVVFLLIAIACDSSPTDSGGLPPGPDKHYRLITVIKEVEGDILSVFDVPADTLIDTLNIGRGFDDIAISSDRSLVFISNRNQNQTVVYRTDSMKVDTVLSRSGKSFIDVDRQLAVQVTSTGFTPFDLFPFLTKVPVSRQIGASGVDLAGGLLYVAGLTEPESSWLSRYDYTSSQLVDSFQIVDDTGAIFFVTELYPVPERSRIYMYAFNNSGSHALIWSTQSNSIVSVVSHRVPVGRFVRSADSASVYKSDPDLSSVFTSGKIWRYDAATDGVVDNLSTIVAEPTGSKTVSVTPMAPTPDGHYLYSSGTTVSLIDGVLLKHRLSDGAASLVRSDLFSQGTMLLVMGPEIVP